MVTEIDIIQEAHPLKQGLKLNRLTTRSKCSSIQEAHPLKQGLKHTILI